MAKDTYQMKAHCMNCNEEWPIEIPKGQPVEAREKMEDCPHCGCSGHISISRGKF